MTSAHGHLKSVRLPKKFDVRTRGFAFLDFVSRRESENAYAPLRHSHLLGRHLVLEWGEEAEQDPDVLRMKAGRRVLDLENAWEEMQVGFGQDWEGGCGGYGGPKRVGVGVLQKHG